MIELMIVVAIVGILVAFAIPGFSRYPLRSKSAEAKVNLMAIATAQEAYSAEFGVCATAWNCAETSTETGSSAFWVT